MKTVKTIFSLAVILVAVAARGATVSLTSGTGDVTLQNNMTCKLEYKSTRVLNLSTTSMQINETSSHDWVVGMGYKINDFKFFGGGGGRKVKGSKKKKTGDDNENENNNRQIKVNECR